MYSFSTGVNPLAWILNSIPFYDFKCIYSASCCRVLQSISLPARANGPATNVQTSLNKREMVACWAEVLYVSGFVWWMIRLMIDDGVSYILQIPSRLQPALTSHAVYILIGKSFGYLRRLEPLPKLEFCSPWWLLVHTMFINGPTFLAYMFI